MGPKIVFWFVMGSLFMGGNAGASVTGLRERFKQELVTLAESSKIVPLLCEEKASEAPAVAVRYRIELGESATFEEAFFLHFFNLDQGRNWSTLIVYDGFDGLVMGSLLTTERGGRIEYTHQFHGYFEDKLKLTVRNGKATTLEFEKTIPGGSSIYLLQCIVL